MSTGRGLRRVGLKGEERARASAPEGAGGAEAMPSEGFTGLCRLEPEKRLLQLAVRSYSWLLTVQLQCSGESGR